MPFQNAPAVQRIDLFWNRDLPITRPLLCSTTKPSRLLVYSNACSDHSYILIISQHMSNGIYFVVRCTNDRYNEWSNI